MKITIKKPRLTSYQTAILYDPARFTICEASTKIGKTFSHIWWIFERAHAPWNEEGFEHWWVAPTYAQARIAFRRIKKKISQLPEYSINKSELSITTPLGSVLRFKTAQDPDALYGEDVYSVVFDEAPRSTYDAFVALRSTVTFTNAPIKMIGNFGGVSNWMHILKEKAKTDPMYAYFKVTAYDAVAEGVLSMDEIEQARKDLDPKTFKALYLAEAQESEEMLCSYEAIANLWTNSFVPGGLKWITADIASIGSDKFKVYVWEGWRVVDVKTYSKLEPDQIEKVLKATAEKWKVPRSNIIYDADGLGIFLRGYLKGATPFNNGGKVVKVRSTQPNFKNLKTQCGYHLAQKINASEVFFDYEMTVDEISHVTAELECLQSYDADKDGKVQLLPKLKIKEIIGRSPDDLDALIMRAYGDIKPKAKAPKATVYD